MGGRGGGSGRGGGGAGKFSVGKGGLAKLVGESPEEIKSAEAARDSYISDMNVHAKLMYKKYHDQKTLSEKEAKRAGEIESKNSHAFNLAAELDESIPSPGEFRLKSIDASIKDDVNEIMSNRKMRRERDLSGSKPGSKYGKASFWLRKKSKASPITKYAGKK